MAVVVPPVWAWGVPCVIVACGVCCVCVLVCCVVGGGPSPPLWPWCVCVCVLCFTVCWWGCCVGLVFAGLAVSVCVCVCVCGVWVQVCGFVVCHTCFGSFRRPTWSRQKAENKVQ